MRSFGTICLILLVTSGLFAQKKARDFKVTTTDKKSIELYKDYLNKGKIVMLKIFFVDCPPCNDIAPSISNLYKQYRTQNVEFIELSNKTWDFDAGVIGYKLKYDLPFPGVSNDGGSVEASNLYSDNYFGPFFGTPTFIIIRPDGTVTWDPRGITRNETVAKLDAALAEAVKSLSIPTPPPPTPVDTTKPTPPPPIPTPVDTTKPTPPPPIPTPVDTTAPKPVPPTIPKLVDTLHLSGKLSLNSTTLGLVKMNLIWNEKSYNFSTDIIGKFKIDLVDTFKNSGSAMLTIDYNQDYTAGVSTSDLILIQKHILGVLRFSDYKQLLAADVDSNGDINVVDLLELRKLILGLTDKLPNSPSVQFIWQSPNNLIRNTSGPISYSDLKSLSGKSFDIQVVKIGNVN